MNCGFLKENNLYSIGSDAGFDDRPNHLNLASFDFYYNSKTEAKCLDLPLKLKVQQDQQKVSSSRLSMRKTGLNAPSRKTGKLSLVAPRTSWVYKKLIEYIDQVIYFYKDLKQSKCLNLKLQLNWQHLS